MKKRIFPIILAIVMTICLAPAAFAAETVSDEHFSLTNVVWQDEWGVPYGEDGEVLGIAGAEYLSSEGAVLTFAEETQISYQTFTDAAYLGVEDGVHWTWAGDEVWLDAQKTFALETNASYKFSCGEGIDFKSIRIVVVADDIAVNYTNGQIEIEMDDTAPAEKTVKPTASTVYVNGEAKAFEAYNIDGNNYFKLRDLASVLNGTEKQFEVGYDNKTKAITLTSGTAYTPVGGEMAKGDGATKTAKPTASQVYLDGEELSLTAYNINGNNFFKLRDLMEAIDVYVGYDNATKNITLDTSKGYVE